MNHTRILAFVLVLQVIIILNQWLGGPLPVARAQIPDTGAQQYQVINELKATNEKLDKLIDILESGKVQIHIIKPDENEKK